MSELTPLVSPYIQELPLELLPLNVLHALLRSDEKKWHVLFDVLHRETYLVATDVISDIVHTGKISTMRETAYRYRRYVGIEVEINSHCNLRCSFCPVSLFPHPRGMMSLDHFSHIVDQALSCDMEEISLNHYSEPTLHPLLGEVVEIAANASFAVTLFTNGTALSRSLINRIAPFRDTLKLVINIAGSTPGEYYRISGRSLFGRVIENVRYAAQSLQVEIVINNGDEQSKARMKSIVPSIPISLWRTDDRAGMVKTAKISSQYHTGLLNGCPLAIRWVNVSVDGDVFFCPQDYWKLNVMGNIFTESLESIFESESAWQFRRWCFGLEEAPNNWICRRCSWTAERKEHFSVGAPLSDVDERVYGNILRQSSPTAIWSVNGKPHSMRCESWKAFANTCIA